MCSFLIYMLVLDTILSPTRHFSHLGYSTSHLNYMYVSLAQLSAPLAN